MNELLKNKLTKDLTDWFEAGKNSVLVNDKDWITRHSAKECADDLVKHFEEEGYL